MSFVHSTLPLSLKADFFDRERITLQCSEVSDTRLRDILHLRLCFDDDAVRCVSHIIDSSADTLQRLELKLINGTKLGCCKAISLANVKALHVVKIQSMGVDHAFMQSILDSLSFSGSFHKIKIILEYGLLNEEEARRLQSSLLRLGQMRDYILKIRINYGLVHWRLNSRRLFRRAIPKAERIDGERAPLVEVRLVTSLVGGQSNFVPPLTCPSTMRLISVHNDGLSMRTPQPVITLPDNWDPECSDHCDPYKSLLKAVPLAVLERIPHNNVPPTDLIFAHYVFDNDPAGRYAAYLTTIPDLSILHCLRSLQPRFQYIQKCGVSIRQQFFAGLDQFLTWFIPNITPIICQMYSFRLEHNRLLSASKHPVSPPYEVIHSMADISETDWFGSDSLWRSFARLNTIEELGGYSDNADVEHILPPISNPPI
ncbi:hypothetical protein BDZ89DRAFT_1033413 [Hymenopellis radicata]|nr:hypothetical protein BDZ89DRAFT_1033413 [Hymenopellis radicata]